MYQRMPLRHFAAELSLIHAALMLPLAADTLSAVAQLIDAIIELPFHTDTFAAAFDIAAALLFFALPAPYALLLAAYAATMPARHIEQSHKTITTYVAASADAATPPLLPSPLPPRRRRDARFSIHALPLAALRAMVLMLMLMLILLY